MEAIERRASGIAALSLSFAVFLSFAVVLTGRLEGAGLTAALVLGAAVISVVFAGRPVLAFRALSADARMSALAGGALLFFAAPAVIAALRMSDAPAGSVVVFWVAGGWAALAALGAAAMAWLTGRRGSSPLLLAGAISALAGAAAVVANWERPSSFSPLVRFPAQELAMLGAGVFVVAGGLLLARAARGGRLPGALVAGSLSATVAALAWVLMAGPSRALGSIAELPVQVALAALAWGVACLALAHVLSAPGAGGLADAGAALAVAPALMSALTWVEQAVGVAGPQPFVIPGLLAGVLAVTASAAALLGALSGPRTRSLPTWALALAALPLAAAAAGLALPAITATVHVASPPTFFDGSWDMPGYEAVAGWVALALAALLFGLASARRRARIAPLIGAAAGVAWFLLRDVPSHVLNDWLSPAVQSYYGTEYGRITFTGLLNVPLILAVAVSVAGLLWLTIANSLPARTVESDGDTTRPGGLIAP